MLRKVKNISKKYAKTGYRFITSRDADTLYYGRIYIDKNREKIKKDPIRFFSKLIQINWLCFKGKTKVLQEELISFEEGIDSYSNRPKVFRFAEQFIGYTDLIMDMENCLYVMKKTKEEIYHEVETYLEIKDFAKVRAKYDSKMKTIYQIYREMSVFYGIAILPDKEIELYNESILLNPYITKALSIVAYNAVRITTYIDTCYDKKIYTDICEKAGIVLHAIETTSDRGTSFELMIKELYEAKKRNCNKEKRYIFLTSNYTKFKKLYMKLDGKMIYYPSTSEYADRIVSKHVVTTINKEEKELMAMHLFCGLRPFEKNYTMLYLKEAPIFFHLLERVQKRAIALDATVIILNDKESELEKLYRKFFEACRIVLWTPLASYEPKTTAEWRDVVKQYPRLNKIPVERIMYALGIGSMLDGKDTIHTMIPKILQCRQPRDQEEVIRYIDEECGDIDSLLLWNPIGGDIMTNTFADGLKASRENRNIYSSNDFNEVEAEIISTIIETMEETLPVLLGIFNDDYAFALPEATQKSSKMILYTVLEDYYQAMYEE